MMITIDDVEIHRGRLYPTILIDKIISSKTHKTHKTHNTHNTYNTHNTHNTYKTNNTYKTDNPHNFSRAQNYHDASQACQPCRRQVIAQQEEGQEGEGRSAGAKPGAGADRVGQPAGA